MGWEINLNDDQTMRLIIHTYCFVIFIEVIDTVLAPVIRVPDGLKYTL